MSKLRIGIFDIETNDLYENVTMGWCNVIVDYHTGRRHVFRPDQMAESAKFLREEFDVVVGHNVIDFDIPTLTKLYRVDYSGIKVFDTLVASRILDPDRLGGHSLKAWGKRLGILKGEYGEQEEAWDKFSEAMLEYCIQDVDVSVRLFEEMIDKLGFDVDDENVYGEII